jgi:hypoxanthine phosphoribosyltransferase
MAITPQQALEVLDDADQLYSEQDIAVALDRMATDIEAALGDKNPLVLCVMLGGLVPMGHLVTRMKFPFQIDYLHATRYRGATEGGELTWLVEADSDLKGRVVLLVDDILDEGHTLASIVQSCKDAGAAEVYSAVLLEKMHGRDKTVSATFCGLQVENRYVFGFGMDYKEYWRNLPGIYAVKEDD